MKHMRTVFIVLILVAIGVFIYYHQSETSAQVDNTKRDTQALGHDAAEGVKDVYDETKKAVKDVAK
jgi:uncharacterized membrane protein